MIKCSVCKKDVPIPYICPHCSRVFCINHYAPEYHDCQSLYRGNESAPANKPHPTSGAGSTVKHTIPILMIVLLAGVFLGYYFGNSQGFYSGNETGYVLGFASGNETGYVLGFASGNETGYAEGVSFGYNTGYSSGYISGNSSGYTSGYNIGYASGREVGYIQGVIDGAGRGYNVRDPTYNEVLTFIKQDKTDLNEYTSTYQCRHFAADVKNNAFYKGYRCAYVSVGFPDSSHAIVAFNTTDNGIIFIEPQTDEIVNLKIGQPYWDRNKYLPPSYNDTVVEIIIVW